MKVQIGPTTYFVSMHHDHCDPPVTAWGDGLKGDRLVSDQVMCLIRNETGACLARGDAFCSVKDVFVLHVGRRKSLERALVKLPFSKTDRTTFWEAFAKTLPKKPLSPRALRRRIVELEEALSKKPVFSFASVNVSRVDTERQALTRILGLLEESNANGVPVDAEVVAGVAMCGLHGISPVKADACPRCGAPLSAHAKSSFGMVPMCNDPFAPGPRMEQPIVETISREEAAKRWCRVDESVTP